MVHFIPIPKLPSAKETAEICLRNVVRLHGLPIDIVSDRRPRLVSRFWRAFYTLMGATGSLSSGYHPQSNRQTERLNQELEKGLCCLVAQTPASWYQNLIWVEFVHNSLPSVSTGLSPFEYVNSYQLPLVPALEREVGVPSAAALIRR